MNYSSAPNSTPDFNPASAPVFSAPPPPAQSRPRSFYRDEDDAAGVAQPRVAPPDAGSPGAAGARDSVVADRIDRYTEAAESEAFGRGRPSTRTPEKVLAVCHFIQITGVSDTAAAALAGVKRSTLSRWKKEDDEVEMLLEAARARYLLPRLTAIGETKRKDGELDWRAQAWLVKFASPEEYGPPSRRRRLRDIDVPASAEDLEEMEAVATAEVIQKGETGWAVHQPGGVITVPMQIVMQIWRARKRAKMRAELDAVEEAKRVAAEQEQAEPTQPQPSAPTSAKATPCAEAPSEVRSSGLSGQDLSANRETVEEEPEKRDNSSRNSSSSEAQGGNEDVAPEVRSSGFSQQDLSPSRGSVAPEKRDNSSRNSSSPEAQPGSEGGVPSRRVGRRELRAIERQLARERAKS